jgi:hypothetical protein
MSGRKSNTPATGSSELTSAGLPWSEVSDFALPYAEWLDGRHVSAEDTLPSVDEIPIPAVLLALPVLQAVRPRGSKAMADVHGARQRLVNCRPGAWLMSPYTGWRWAKWPNGEVGWLSADTFCQTPFACDRAMTLSNHIQKWPKKDVYRS